MGDPIDPTIELEHAVGFAGQPNSLFLHPNGREYIYVAGACVVIADLQDAHQQEFIRGHDDNVSCLHISKSGQWLVSGQRGTNANVCVWRYQDRSIVYRLEEHDFGVKCVTMSHDEKLLLTVGEAQDGKMVVWDMSIGHIVCYMNVSDWPEPVTLVEWGGKVQDIKRRETDFYQYCVLAGNDVYYHMLNPMTGQQAIDKISTTTHVRRGSAAQFSSTGDLLFVGSESGDVAIYSLKEKKLLTSHIVCSGGVRCLFIPPKEKPQRQQQQEGGFRYANFGDQDHSVTIYASGGDGSVSLYALKDPQQALNTGLDERNRLTVEGEVTSLSFSQDLSVALLGTTQGTVQYCSIRQGQTPAAQLFMEAPLASVRCVRFHPTVNDRFATASEDALVRIWDSSSYRVLSTCGGASSGLGRCIAKPYGGQAVGNQNTAQRRGRTGPSKDVAYPVCVSYIGQMDICLSAWSDGCIRSFDVSNGEFLWSVDNAHRCGITSIVVAPNLKFFVTGGEEGEVRLWEMSSREMVSELKEHKGSVTGLKLMEDSCHLLSSSRDKSVITWDLMKERRSCCHEQKMGAICGLDLYRNQSNFVTVGLEKRVSVWDLRQVQPVASQPYCETSNRDAYGTVVALSNHNRFMCLGGTDQLVRLWDASTLTQLEVGVGHSGVVNDVQWSPDDKQVVSVGSDACAFLWNIYS